MAQQNDAAGGDAGDVHGPVDGSGSVENKPLFCWGAGATAEATVINREDMVVGRVCEGMEGGRPNGLCYVAGIAVN